MHYSFIPHTIKAGALTFTLVLINSAAHAQPPEGEGPGADGSGWSLGIAALTDQRAYTDFDRETIAFPFVSFENKYLRWFGPTLDFKLPGITFSESQELNFNISLDYEFDGYDKDQADETLVLNGMGERKGGLWAGAKLEWRNPLVDTSLKWMGDASGNSKGQKISLGLEKTWFLGPQVMITPHVTATHFDEKYVDYYYGVLENESRTGRPEYIGEAGLNVSYGLRAAYLFNQNHSMFVDLAATSLSNEIQDSPLVDSSTENSVFFVYMYSF